jgi:hypothetical protein
MATKGKIRVTSTSSRPRPVPEETVVQEKEEVTRFPIYEKMCERIADSSVEVQPLEMLIPTINTLPKEHCYVIYAMMIHHDSIVAKKQGKKAKDGVAQGCRTVQGGKGIIATISNLDPDLQKIISTYVTLISV